MDRDRLRLKAANQELFREVNERIAEITHTLADHAEHGTLEVLCECSRPDCVSRLPLTFEQYDDVRASPETFVVISGHEEPEVEEVVADHGRYAVVRPRSG